MACKKEELPITTQSEQETSELFESQYEVEIRGTDRSESAEVDQLCRVCAQCILVARHFIGKPTRPYRASPQELSAYIQRVFNGILQKESDLINKYVNTIPLAKLSLSVNIIQAEGLLVVDGKSVACNAYVEAYIKDNTKSRTQTANNTNSPRWNENITLSITDPSKETLRINVWRKEAKSLSQSLRQILSTKSYRKFPAAIRTIFYAIICHHNQDSLLGALIKPLAEIPSVGADQWYQLKTESGNGLFGRLQICLQFLAERPNSHDPLQAFNDHRILSLVLLEYNTDMDQSQAITWNKWEDCLSREGLTMLHQHSLRLSIRPIEKCFAYLSSVAHVRSEEGARINYSVHYLLLKELELEMKQQSFDDSVISKQSVEAVCSLIITKICDFLESLHENINPKNQRHTLDLLGLLSCCYVIESIVGKSGDIVDAASEAVLKDSSTWHNCLVNLLSPPDCSGGQFVQVATDVLQQIVYFHKGVNSIFKQAWNETYTEITIDNLDDLMDQHVRPRVVDFCSSLTRKDEKASQLLDLSLDLFYIIQRFVMNIDANVHITAKRRWRMNDYLYWFGPNIACEWFESSRLIVIRYIQKCVESDTLLSVSSTDRVGASAKETSITLQERFVSLWTNLMWPQSDVCKKYIDCVCQCTLCYTQNVEEKIKRERIADVGDHGISIRICIALNNVTWVSSFTNTTVRHSVETCMKAAPEYDDMIQIFCIPIDKTVQFVNVVVRRLCDLIMAKLEPELMRCVENIIRCRDASEQDKALYALSNYSNNTLAILHSNLDSQAFQTLLLELWIKSTVVMKQVFMKLYKWHFCKFRNNAHSFSGLLEGLHRLRKVYHADGGGLSPEELHCKEYKEFRDQLTEVVRRLSSSKRL